MKIEDKTEIFESMPVAKALATLAVPTIVSQIIGLVYNMVDAFFIGRTGNSYMMAATTLTLTLAMMNTALSNLFGIGGGSQFARLMGQHKSDEAKSVSSFSFYGAGTIALIYSSVIGLFLHPVLNFLGASDETLGYATQYTLLVIIAGSLPSILSMTLAHILRNAGYSSKASIGLSSGGLLNIVLDPLFMFVLLPNGYEVIGAALATLLSNMFSCAYLLHAFAKDAGSLSMKPKDAKNIRKNNIRQVFSVGIPSTILTGLFDLANVCVNILAAAHSDFVLAGMGIVMKVERIPTAINLGICQGMIPLVAYNYSSGNRERMRKTVSTARMWGLVISGISVVLFQMFAEPVTRLFMSTSSADAETALLTVGFAALFLRIRSVASPFQFMNYHSSYCMQAMGDGKRTMLHAFVRELVFYIPFMFLLDGFFGECGLALALALGEVCGAAFALILLHRSELRNI